MEAETLLAMKSHFKEELPAPPDEQPTDFYDSNRRQIQEWDGVLLSDSTLYLLEAKHSMSIKKVKQLADRVKAFPQTLERSTRRDLDGKYSRIVGVACGTHFPEDSRKEAHRLGLMVMYPSGRRYLVESGEDLVLER
jgi:hypothetical protein